MAVKNRGNLQTTINDNLPNNSEGTITPEKHREVETDLNDSVYNKLSDANLVGLKIYDPTRSYTSNEAAVYNDGSGLQVWLSNKVTTGTFIPADWDLTEGAVNEAPTDSRYYARGDSQWLDIGSALGVALKLKNVNSLSDLPTAVAGVITLEEGVDYKFTALVNIGTDRIDVGASNKLSSSGFGSGIQSTAISGNVVTVPNGADFFMEGVSIVCPNTTTGLLFNGSSNVFLDSNSFIGCDVGINVNEVDNAFIKDNYFEGCGTCITYTGSNNGYSLLEGNYFNVFSNYAVNYGSAVLRTVIANNNLFEGQSASFYISGLVNSGNISKRAVYSLNNFNGLSTGLENISEADLKHEFIYNDGNRRNSSDYGRVYFVNNGLTTAINTINVPVPINGTFTLGDSARFTQGTNGELTYNGNYSNTHEINLTVLAEKLGGGGVSSYAFDVLVNGTPITESQTVVTTASNNPINGSVSFFYPLSTNDVISMEVANITGTENLTVIEASLNVKRLT